MRIALALLSSMVTWASAEVGPAREAARQTARIIYDEIQANHQSLLQAVVGSASCDPATGELAAGEPSAIPCVALYYRSETMERQLKNLFGTERDGVPIAYSYCPPGHAVAFEAIDTSLAARELEARFLEHPGVVAVGMALGPTSAIISVADPETERLLLEEYPPGSRLHGVPVAIERQRTYDARDPVVKTPCEPALAKRGWPRFKRRLKRFFSRPVR